MSATPAPAPPVCLSPIDVGPAFGPPLFGLCLNWLLLGVLITQVYDYYNEYHARDKWFIKTVVYGLLVVELTISGLVTHAVFSILIEGWGNIGVLVALPFSFAAVAISAGVVAAAVQIFFAWRIWVLNRGKPVVRSFTFLIVALALFQASGASYFSIRWGSFYKMNTLQVRAAGDLVTASIIWLAGSFATDFCIALAMVYSLYAARSQASSRRTDGILSQLMVNTVATGVVTTIVALIDLLLFVLPSMKDNNYHSAPAVTLGKVYSTMLLVNLNRRRHFDSKNISQNGLASMNSAHRSDNGYELQSARAMRLQNITVTTTVNQDLDPYHQNVQQYGDTKKIVM